MTLVSNAETYGIDRLLANIMLGLGEIVLILSIVSSSLEGLILSLLLILYSGYEYMRYSTKAKRRISL